MRTVFVAGIARKTVVILCHKVWPHVGLNHRTLIGFRLKIKKASARCVKNRVNLCTRICSISSACLIFMLMRTLLILGSIKTLSLSFREMTRGLRRASGDEAASISGTLCLSDVCEAKLDSVNAAVKDDRTHCRYGRSD
jgi:hypothetical protein